MFAALLRKELRQLLPWVLMIVALYAGSFVVELCLSPPDEITWIGELPIFAEEAPTEGVWLLVLALVFAYAGFPREHDEGTLPFLFSLPVSRSLLFLSKALAAGIVLSGEVVLGAALHFVAHLPNPTSFVQGSFRWDWQLCAVGLPVALGWIWLGYALFLSVFRRFGVLVLLVGYVALMVAKTSSPGLAVLDPAEILRIGFWGTRPIVPWTLLLGHLGVAFIGAVGAGLLWVGPRHGVAATAARWSKAPVTRWIASLVAVGALLSLAVALIAREGSQQMSAEFGAVAELTSPEARLQTRRYEFRFPEVTRPRIETLSHAADELFDALALRLGAEPGEGRVVVDLTRASRGFAGTATWDTIRMDLAAASDDEALKRTLAHESSHVLGLRASDRRLESLGDSLRFFDEGLAEWSSLELVPRPAYADARRFEAALLRSRKRTRPLDLMSFATFSRRFGEPALYGAGLVWIEALLEKCGPDAPRRVLQTLARPNTPTHLVGEPLWQHLLQLLGCDVVSVEHEWELRLSREIEEHADELARVPTLIGGAPRRDEFDGMVLTAELDGTPIPDAVYFVSVRGADPAADASSFSGAVSSERRIEFWVPLGFERSGVLEFQLAQAWERGGALVGAAEDWQSAPVQ